MPPQNLDRQITYEYSLIELLSSGSTRTSYDCIFSEGTPCRSSIWTTAREKPHWGMSGVPFMKSTSGLALTAPSIFARTSWVMKRSEPSLWAAKVFGTVLVADRRNRDCMATEVTETTSRWLRNHFLWSSPAQRFTHCTFKLQSSLSIQKYFWNHSTVALNEPSLPALTFGSLISPRTAKP